MKTKNLLVSLIATLVAISILVAPNARGQTPAPTGPGTTSVVEPSELPSSLSLIDEESVLDSISRNRQWYQNGNPLIANTSIRVTYSTLGGGSSYISWVDEDHPFDSFRDFQDLIAQVVADAVRKIIKSPNFDKTKALVATVNHSYGNLDDPSDTGIGFSLKYNLGTVNNGTAYFFDGSGYVIQYARITLRVKDLTGFEVTRNGLPYFRWVPTDGFMRSAGQLVQARPGLISIDGIAFARDKTETRLTIRTSRETAVYNQNGSRLSTPSIRMVNQDQIEITSTTGFTTVIEYSTDLDSSNSWYVLKRISPSENGGARRVFVYPPSSTQEKMFFRVWSK